MLAQATDFLLEKVCSYTTFSKTASDLSLPRKSQAEILVRLVMLFVAAETDTNNQGR